MAQGHPIVAATTGSKLVDIGNQATSVQKTQSLLKRTAEGILFRRNLYLVVTYQVLYPPLWEDIESEMDLRWIYQMGDVDEFVA